MRDIRGDLQDRADRLKQQINAAEAQFEKHFEQLKEEQTRRLEDLGAQLDAVKRLIAVATWYHNVLAAAAAALAAATAAAEATEAACRSSPPEARRISRRVRWPPSRA
jgi:septal ring factor EnvC (AmiA/AmiB activator)